MASPTTPSPTGRADARRNREQILDAAASVLGTDPAASIVDIAAAAGLGRATVYRHFPDVAAIHAALADEARAAGKGIVRERLGSEPRDGWCEGSLGDVLLQMTRENLPTTSRWGATLASEPLQDEELIGTFTSIVAATLKQGQQRGEFRQDVDPEVIAEAFVAMTFRAARLVHGRGVDVEVAMQAVTVFIDGLRRRAPRA
jgi:TetR/AcrR family transcriptional regulator, mexCD-oprJ operon repressor